LGDIHGDEEIEYNFLAGNEGIPAWDDRLKRLQDEFCQAFLHTSPDFQLGNGYGTTCLEAWRGFLPWTGHASALCSVAA
jgi:hypothetical protein